MLTVKTNLLVCFLFVCLSLCITFSESQAKEPYLIIDARQGHEDLRNFRRMIDGLRDIKTNSPSQDGLSLLKASGSAQFSEKGLKMLKNMIKNEKIIIVDLREESHGFMNGIPVSWREEHNCANKGRSLKEIEKDERQRLDDAIKKKSALVAREEARNGSFETLKVNRVYTEKELCARLGLGYIRIPVTDHHRPSDEETDRFLKFVRTMPSGAWLHFHCKAGIGRTAVFLSMYDMMKNASKVSRNDIVRRQFLFGGHDLFAPASTDDWKYPASCERSAFIWRFYDYSRSNSDKLTTPWSAWLKKMKID